MLIVMTAVSASVPPCCTAIARNVPVPVPAVKRPPLVMLPPVADQFTVMLDVLPLLIRPTAVNCCVAPVLRFAEAGEISTAVRVGAVALMVMVEVSAWVPPCRTAIARKVPAVLPAV